MAELSGSYHIVDWEAATTHKEMILNLRETFGVDNELPSGIYAKKRLGGNNVFNGLLMQSRTNQVKMIWGQDLHENVQLRFSKTAWSTSSVISIFIL